MSWAALLALALVGWIAWNKSRDCPRCDGSGVLDAPVGERCPECPSCGGTGERPR